VKRLCDGVPKPKNMTDLFSLSVDDDGKLTVAIRRDFWEHGDEDAMLLVIMLATFALSENDDVLQAKTAFADVCSGLMSGGTNDVMPEELMLLRDGELSGLERFVFPISPTVH